jgi:hypothetical protein
VFEFFKPVEDDVDLGWLSLFFRDHQESLAVRRDVQRNNSGREADISFLFL